MSLVKKSTFLNRVGYTPGQQGRSEGFANRDDFVSGARAIQLQRQQKTYEQYKKAVQAAQTIQHDQQSGYNRTAQLKAGMAAQTVQRDQQSGYNRTIAMRPDLKTIQHDQQSGYRKTAQIKQGMAEPTIRHDQQSGRKRTAEELQRRIDQMEQAQDYANSMEAEGAPMEEYRGAYNAVNAGRQAPMTRKEMSDELAYLRYRLAAENRTAAGRMGEYAEDLGTSFFTGGFEQFSQGFEKAMDYVERGANAAGAAVLRDLSNSAILRALGGEKIARKMRAIADDFDSYASGETQTMHEDLAQAHRAELQALSQELQDKYAGSPVGSWVMQQMPSAGNMVFGAGVSSALGIPNLATLGVTAGGSAAMEAREKGATDEQALAYGIVAGGLEVFSEKLFGGNPLYDTDAGLVNRAVSKLTDNKTIMRILNSKAFDIASEGLEEVVTEVLDPVAEWAIYNGKKTEFASAEDIGNAFLGGVFLSALGNVADAPGQIRQAKYENTVKAVAGALAQQANTTTDESVRQAAQVITDKLAYGVTPEVSEIGAVIDAMDKAGAEIRTEAIQQAAQNAENQGNGAIQAPADGGTPVTENLNGSRAAETGRTSPVSAVGDQGAFEKYNQYAEERETRRRAIKAEAEPAEARRRVYAAEERGEITHAEAEQQLDAMEQAEPEGEQGAALESDRMAVRAEAAEAEATKAVQQRAQAETERAEAELSAEARASDEQTIRQWAKRKGYSETLTAAIVEGYSRSHGAIDAAQYAEQAGKAYEYGKSGFSQSAAQKAAQGITKDVAAAAWSAGKEQANEKTTGKQSANDGGKRNAGVDSGRQTRTVAKDTGAAKQKSAEIERAKTNLSRQNRVRDTGAPYLSGKEIGLSRGAERRSFREAPESTWDAEMKNAAETLRRAGFEDVHFVVGSIGVTNQKANVTRYVDGAMVGDAVWVNATAKKFTVTQLANHEAFHRAIQDAPYLQDSVLAVLTDQLGEEGIQELAQKYAEAYEGCYDAEDMEAYIEEICADAYAGMSRLPDVKEKLIQKAAERAQKAAQETEESGGQRAPPEERYSVSKDFSADVQEWYEEGMPAGESFVLGSTGETLQGLGAIESDIYMNGDKIRTILKEHPEMTIREIQKIPELLDDPVLILKSQNVGREGKPNSRLVIFGTVKAQNGQPVLSVLDLRPRERGFVIDDMQKVTSAYTKDNPTVFVANSDVLFADRKRTIPLLRRFGLTIASRELLRDGSVGSISYSGNDVKLNGAPFSSIVSTRNDASEKFSAVEENFEDVGPADVEAQTQYTLDSIPKKAQTYLMRSLNQTAAQIQNTLSLPFAARQEVLKPALETMMNEYLQTGRISQETMDKAFEDSYEKGVELDTEFYDQYKDVKKWMQTTAVTLSEADRADIADFNAFRKEAFGRLRITNVGGTPVDTAYMELHEQAPELFPVGITHPADQLMQMFNVSRSIERVQRSLDEAHGSEAAEFKRWAKNDYEASVEGMLGSLRVARRYAEARMRQEQSRPVPQSMEEVKALYKDLKSLRRVYERAASKTLLTEEDNRAVNRLLRGELAPEDVQGMENAQGILSVYEAKADYDAAVAKIAQWKRHRKGELRKQADALLENADKAKDKKAGILYSRETMTRNVRDIFPEADAERINKAIFEPVRAASAEANRLTNRLRDEVREMNLSRKVEKGNLVSEAHAVQLLGEAQDNIRMLEQKPYAQKRDGKTLDEWRSVVVELWETSPGLDRAKIERSVEGFRKIYDGLFEQMNDVRIRNGYEPVNYRSGYFPHFQPGTTDGILGLMGKALGIDAEVTALPTTINGLTHTFKPGITYFGHALERLSFDTAYDAVEGFDKYVEGAVSVICYTDAIQRLRAFTDQVRYRTSDEGLRERIDAVREMEDVSEQDKELRIREIMEKGRYSLSNFAVELDEYTNLLANKKSKYDRTVEGLAGRNAYNFMKAWENRVAANMVAVNPASWLTNFGVITQAGAQLKTTSVLKAMWQTLQSYKQSDGVVEQSDFLTNRRGSDPLVRSWQQGLSAKLSTPMDWIDTFSAGTIVRARYMENLERGMNEETAMNEADDFAANVMADRSKGATPTLFSARNPIFKLFTQFQLEVNNTFSYLFKDLPREQRKKGIGALAAALFKFLIGGFLYDELYEYLIGRRPMLDPAGILNDTVGDATGYELNNLVDAALGGGFIKETERQGVVGTASNLISSVLEEAPFVGNIAGGGKLPFANSLPSLTNIASAAASETATTEEKAAKIGKELLNPAAYWLLPFGGGQVKKMAQGILALKRGGSYTAGGDLQYPIYTDRKGDTVKAAARTLLFGKSATPEAQAWVEAGFGSLSEKATQTYEAMREAGIDQRDSYELIKAMSKVKKTDEASEKELKMQLLNAFDIEDAGKALYYYNMMATDKEKATMEELMEEGADMGEYLRFLTNAAGVTGEKDENGNTISGSRKAAMLETITAAELTPEQKNAMAEAEGYTLTGFEPWTQNYDTLYRAVSTGKTLKQTVAQLRSDGYEDKALREAVTTMFKSEYLDADRESKARLKGYLRNAFMQLGLTEKEAMRKIEGWEESK